MKSCKNGVLVSFEGIDGSGKTTQFELLSEWFQSQNYQLVQETIHKTLRQLTYELMEEGLDEFSHCLLAAAKHRLTFRRIIEPALQEGKLVLIDRYIDSSIVYSRADGLPTDFMNNIYTHFHRPDLTLFFDTPPIEALRRKGINGIDRVEQGKTRDVATSPAILFLQHQEKAYREYIRHLNCCGRFRLIRGNQDPQEVHDDVKEAVLEAFSNANGHVLPKGFAIVAIGKE